MFSAVRESCCELGALVKVASLAARDVMLDLKMFGFSMYATVEKVPEVT